MEDQKTYKIILADGTIIDNLTLNGNNYISAELIDASIFEGNCSPIVIKRPLKNIPFFRFISITHKKSTSFDYSGGFFVIWIKFPIISSVISVYFSFISLMIRLRFTANIAIAPCISMLMRPDDDAVS